MEVNEFIFHPIWWYSWNKILFIWERH